MLAHAGRAEPRRLARRLVAAALDLSTAEVLMHPPRPLTAQAAGRIRNIVERVAQGEPPSRVIGRREFWGLEFALSPETLDPRPDSETVVEAVLARIGDRRASWSVLDLGTGTGCLLLALLSELPGASGLGIDISGEAIGTARRNSRALGLARRARFAVGDWADAVGSAFDVVVANPPYIASADLAGLPADVARYDPRLALDGGADGLAAHRRIAERLSRVLAPAGVFVGEVGAGQAGSVARLLRVAGLFPEAIERDLAGIERCVVARLISGAKATGSGKKTLE